MTVNGGVTVTIRGTFLADSVGTMGTPLAEKWNLVAETLPNAPRAKIFKGKGKFDQVNEIPKGGDIIKIASAIPGGADVFVVSGTVTQDSDSALELQSGTLSVEEDFTQQGGSTTVYVGGSAPGLLTVMGTVTLAGTFDALPAPDFVGGAPLTVVDNLGPGPVDGYFADLPQGAPLRVGDWLYQITYIGGDGNDVVLLPVTYGQWANLIINFGSEFNPSPGDYSANQALGPPNVSAYGDNPKAWSPAAMNGNPDFLTVAFPTPVYAQGLTVRETNGNGFVTRIDLLGVDDNLYPIWTGTDPNQPGSPGELTLAFAPINVLVKGVKIYVNTDHNANTFEQIDAVILFGEAGGGLAALGGGAGGPRPGSPRVSGLRKGNVGPFAALSVSGPVALGVPATLLFSGARDGSRSVLASSFRYSFDFNNDGDFTDPGEVRDGTSPSARHTFTRRGWHVIHGRVRAADGRVTDFWLRVFVP